MTKINCIIIEDEPLALERAKGYIAKVSYLQLLQAFNNPLDGFAFLKQNKVDLIFLDIKMDQLTGIQLLESISFKGNVIITTAYDEYAIKGYELNVTDYLLKPYTFERFLQAIDKIQDLNKPIKSTREYIFIKTENRLEKVNLEDILFIEGMRDYRRIHLENKRIMTLQTFTEFEKNIPSSKICRVQKSFMVSVNKIESIERKRIKIKDNYIPFSDSYKSKFLDIINNN